MFAEHKIIHLRYYRCMSTGFKSIIKGFIPEPVLKVILPIYHFSRALIANIIYGFPAKHMHVVMVTGTNGKTTTAVLIAKILEEAGNRVGLSSTAFFQIKDKIDANDQNMTVTNPFALQKLLERMKKAEVDFAVIEVTSHALSQYRTWGIPVETAVMTNLTQDHLDYHGTMEKYALAKGKLFAKKPNFMVLNGDDEWFEFFDKYQAKVKKVVYGTKELHECRIVGAKLGKKGSALKLALGEEELEVNLGLVGKFNAYNALSAASTAYSMGVTPKYIKRGLEAVSNVPGRLEKIEEGQKFDVIVDYAHTPDALKNSLETLKAVTKGKIITVFGATGDRDKDKRPKMGKIVGSLSDSAIVTDDEPYSEDPAKIRGEVIVGFQETGADTREVASRREAISMAIGQAKPGDTVYITGMGHQQFRVVGDSKEKWDDRSVAREILKKK